MLSINDIGKYKLRDWVNTDNIYWYCLSLNTNDINLLEKNLDKI